MDQQHLEEVKQYVQERRSQEGNFGSLQSRLDEEIGWAEGSGLTQYVEDLREVKQKNAEPYLKQKEAAGTAWPEFEKFVSAFERAITGAMKN